jgi:hypothetical protein
MEDPINKKTKRPLTLKEAKARFPKQKVRAGIKPGSFSLTNRETGSTSKVSSWTNPNAKTIGVKGAVQNQLTSK